MSLEIEYLSEGDLRRHFKQMAKKGWVTPEPEVFPSETDINSGPMAFFPLKKDIFKAFTLLAPDEVKYVILGQDPYFTEHENTAGKIEPDATGIAFLIDPDRKDKEDAPPSFKRFEGVLYPEWNTYSSMKMPQIKEWFASRKALLLNAALTVPRPEKTVKIKPKVAGKHVPYWKDFMAEIVKQVVVQSPEAKLFAFGVDARNVICEALRLAGRYHFCHHPAARSSPGDKYSFDGSLEKISSDLYVVE